ncbi:hypothetical protein [Acrocarpospora catenulata]|uniref:hypothetical protein n=1 Tax=Acrocarpospora catenulata TaxID=2836182 RepID=UPI001BDA3C35|nr:hypothetical protein [Acrocarpospora catenulata]
MAVVLAVLTVAACGGVADTHTHTAGVRHEDTIRYVSVRGCSDPDEWPPSACGNWRLATHGGEIQELADAWVEPLNAEGKQLKQAQAPIEVSGDGRHVAYFRKSDNRLVVREVGGQVHAMAADVLPRGFGMDDVKLMLSQDGTRLGVIYYEERKEPTRVYDTTTGVLLWTAPWDVEFYGFSGDAGELLAYREGDDFRIADLYVFGPPGELLHRKPSGEGVALAPYALAADGTTTAAVTSGHQGEGTDVVVYDLTSGRITTRLPVPLESLHTIAWTGPAQITIHDHHKEGNAPTQVRVLQIDTTTKKITTRDAYTVLPDSLTFESCGG